ncbi:MAG: PAS domain S-box protein [Acidobacteriia bacterium]|nr:PAS domain S-box protein [Terriglobia bacterium]
MAEKRWFWATLTLSSITIVSVVAAAWELAENRFFRDANYLTLHYLYVTRGVASSLLLAFWAAWFVLRQRRKSEEDLRRSRERYRGLLEAFPGAVVLYDSSLSVLEWNASAERMYGYSKGEICGKRLPIVPAAKAAELAEFMGRVERGQPVVDVETLRLAKGDEPFEVQLSLLPYREPAMPAYFLEVTSDIRERVRWRERMLQIEKLTSMGKMAAGTAHHLNSPLAALLIRVQLMRQRATGSAFVDDVAHIEEGLNFCRHFVQRLLEFTRATPVQKQAEDLGAIVESVASFFLPAIQSKRATLLVDACPARGRQVYADRNLLETLLLILLSNALDAVSPGGEIRVYCRQISPGHAGFAVSDNGCGIGKAQREHVFEPFFTTKGPGKGTGLGLAIAKNVVLEHGGTIEIESELGRGTTAFVDLPLAEVPEMERVEQ